MRIRKFTTWNRLGAWMVVGLAPALAIGQANPILPGFPDYLRFDGQRLLGWRANKSKPVSVRIFRRWTTTVEPSSWTVCLWSAKDGRLLRTFNGSLQQWNASFSPTGLVAATSWVPYNEVDLEPRETAVRIWDPKTGRLVMKLKNEVLAAFSPDGKKLATFEKPKRGRNWSICLFDMRSRKRLWGRMISQVPEDWRVEFSPDGKLMLVEGPEQEYNALLDATDGESVAGKIAPDFMRWHGALRNTRHFLGSGSLVALRDPYGGFGKPSGQRVDVLDLSHGTLARQIVFLGGLFPWAWAVPGRMLFGFEYNVSSMTLTACGVSLLSGKAVESKLQKSEDFCVFGPGEIAVAPDGSRFAATISFGHTNTSGGPSAVVLFDGTTCKELKHNHQANLIGFSPDSTRYLTRAYSATGATIIFVHDAATGALLRTFTLQDPPAKHKK